MYILSPNLNSSILFIAFMDKFQAHKIMKSILLPLVFLFQFSSILLISSAYTLPDKYFINCGSKTNVNSGDRVFTGDLNSSSVSFTTWISSPVRDSNQVAGQTETIYQTARVFRQNSKYEFEISNTSTPYLEFLFNITSGKFDIYFVPQESSFAFVNAIEVFRNPEFNPFNGNYYKEVVSNYYKEIVSKALYTIHRINVGGPTEENDTLWRNWVPDDSYLYNSEAAENGSYAGKLNYVKGVAALDFVYRTSKQIITADVNQSNNFNLTWNFSVSKNTSHFVRVHFCDTVSLSLNVLSVVIFNLSIAGKFRHEINTYNDAAVQLAAPFYFDFVVDSDDSGILNISVGPNAESLWKKTAFLNGLEIMEIMNKSVSEIPLINNGTKKGHALIVVVSVLGGLVFIGVLAVFIFFGLKKYRKTNPGEPLDSWSALPVLGGGSTHSRVTEKSINGSNSLNLGLKVPFGEIQFATKNFDSKLVIGKGGFGTVYKGIFRNGVKVAVKRSQPGSGQGLSEFQTEIMVLSKIHNRHLVSLIGYCDERSEMILVYDFMEKGTLKDHLYDSKFPCLSWKQRLEICIGAARGLQYLHKGSDVGIIHRDVKSTNILLDENLVAKVADFGLSRSGPLDHDQTHVSTAVKGTFGYLDPEYFSTQQLTEKSDVYSFGVLLLEVLCARPAIEQSLPRDQVNLADWGMLCKNKGCLEDIIDPLIKDQINPNSLKKFTETFEKCLQEDSSNRPTMGDVLWDLEYALQLQQSPTKREPHEDSTTDASNILTLLNVRRIPSLSESTVVEDGVRYSDS
ncbi:hypothetical protein Ddye_010609 [Dipteronia dyeriana]|uniref:Protein kinase domain-containing protein n=1 Tax=Dipteronia dyeriana TaxID=168575 RepID=A0AAD9XE19_9ROSI|nr:hypothetical protein Ddye_010609 [Dipteronia dyeriana]